MAGRAAADHVSPRGAVELAGRVARGSFTLDVGLHLPGGQVCAVTGPNGAGKSTLLRVLAGLDALDAGRLALDGQVVDDPASGTLVPPPERRVGMVFQGYRLFGHLDVADNVGFAVRARGASRRAARAQAGPWLERLGLTALAGRRPHQLSGGQAQRVALARALAARPRLLLLDEPLAALDPAGRTQLRELLAEHLDGFAGTVLLVTHDRDDAARLADRVVTLREGRLTADTGPPGG